VQPLGPPVFNKIATHSKNLRFFVLFVFGLACFQPVVIFVDFQIPFGTHLLQNGMNMVLKTNPLGCLLIQFRPMLPKTTQPTTPRTFFPTRCIRSTDSERHGQVSTIPADFYRARPPT
jgi:hypothetical protein